MASTDVGAGAGQRGRQQTTGRNSMKMITRTEARRAFMTTEFWLAIAMAAAVIIAAYINDSAQIGLNQAWAIGAGVIAFYVLSRGIAKSGSSDPEVRDIDF